MNTSVDAGALPSNDLTIADNIIFATSGARIKREALRYFDTASPSAFSIVGIHDYWRTDTSIVKQQLRISVTSEPKFYSYDSGGVRTELTNGGTAMTTITTAIMSTMNEDLIFGFDVIGNIPKKYNPDDSPDVEDLGGTPPDFSTCQVHQSRLWANDKENPDRLHASSTGNPEEWGGVGDSWVVDIDPGDGDARGIVQIHPPFKGDLFLTKGRKTYRVTGNHPANYQVLPVTVGLGGTGARSIAAVDLDDVVYCSEKGFHSLAATDTHGDFKGAFLSAKIQPTFNDFNQARLQYTQAAYVPDLNSIAFAVSGPSATENDQLYFYNINIKEWYRWPDVSCQSITTHIADDGLTKLLIGTSDGRLVESQDTGVYTDFGTTGIDYRIKSGALYPSGDPNAWVGFKRLTLLFKPLGDFQFTATITIDNQAPQSISFQEDAGGAILGSTFVLGSSVLGSSSVLAPYSFPIDGYGRGCTLEITQNGMGEQVEIYGVIIEYEMADVAQEVLGTQ